MKWVFLKRKFRFYFSKIFAFNFHLNFLKARQHQIQSSIKVIENQKSPHPIKFLNNWMGIYLRSCIPDLIHLHQQELVPFFVK